MSTDNTTTNRSRDLTVPDRLLVEITDNGPLHDAIADLDDKRQEAILAAANLAVWSVRRRVEHAAVTSGRRHGWCGELSMILADTFPDGPTVNGQWRDNTGMDCEQYDIDGFNIHGRDRFGFDRDGLDPQGRTRDGRFPDGYDGGGFNTDGVSTQGLPRREYLLEYDSYGTEIYRHLTTGIDAFGYDRDGYDAAGYDKRGFNRDGYDRDGYDREGYNADGFNRPTDRRSGYTAGDYRQDGRHAATNAYRTGFSTRGVRVGVRLYPWIVTPDGATPDADTADKGSTKPVGE